MDSTVAPAVTVFKCPRCENSTSLPWHVNGTWYIVCPQCIKQRTQLSPSQKIERWQSQAYALEEYFSIDKGDLKADPLLGNYPHFTPESVCTECGQVNFGEPIYGQLYFGCPANMSVTTYCTRCKEITTQIVSVGEDGVDIIGVDGPLSPSHKKRPVVHDNIDGEYVPRPSKGAGRPPEELIAVRDLFKTVRRWQLRDARGNIIWAGKRTYGSHYRTKDNKPRTGHKQFRDVLISGEWVNDYVAKRLCAAKVDWAQPGVSVDILDPGVGQLHPQPVRPNGPIPCPLRTMLVKEYIVSPRLGFGAVPIRYWTFFQQERTVQPLSQAGLPVERCFIVGHSVPQEYVLVPDFLTQEVSIPVGHEWIPHTDWLIRKPLSIPRWGWPVYHSQFQFSLNSLVNIRESLIRRPHCYFYRRAPWIDLPSVAGAQRPLWQYRVLQEDGYDPDRYPLRRSLFHAIREVLSTHKRNHVEQYGLAFDSDDDEGNKETGDFSRESIRTISWDGSKSEAESQFLPNGELRGKTTVVYADRARSIARIVQARAKDPDNASARIVDWDPETLNKPTINNIDAETDADGLPTQTKEQLLRQYPELRRLFERKYSWFLEGMLEPDIVVPGKKLWPPVHEYGRLCTEPDCSVMHDATETCTEAQARIERQRQRFPHEELKPPRQVVDRDAYWSFSMTINVLGGQTLSLIYNEESKEQEKWTVNKWLQQMSGKENSEPLRRGHAQGSR